MPNDEFAPDVLPASLAPDGAQVPRTIAFTGFLGASHLDGHVRLYLDEELREWFDVSTADILYSLKYDNSELPGTVIWVDHRTSLQRRMPQREEFNGEYLTNAETVPQSAMSVALDYSWLLRTPMKSPWRC